MMEFLPLPELDLLDALIETGITVVGNPLSVPRIAVPSLQLPELDLLGTLVETGVAGVAAGFDIPLCKGLEDGAVRLLQVSAVVVTTLPQIGCKVREGILEIFLKDQLHLLRIEGGEAGGINAVGILSQAVQLHMTGGVAASAQLVGDLPGSNGQTGIEAVQDTGLAYTGIPREDNGLPTDGL